MSKSQLTLHEHLKKIFGFSSFKGRQEEIIKNLRAGNDSLVIMPTGGGKSMCYQLPALIDEGVAIIVSPLIALMKNQVDALRGFNEDDRIAHVLNSSLNKQQVQEVKDDLSSGKTKLLYVAPESLTKEEYILFFRTIKISFYSVDEAHCISEWGHDFRPEYRKLRQIIDNIGRKPIIALTATATPKVQQDIQKNLKLENATLYLDSFNRENLFYDIRPKINVEKEIIKFIKQHTGKSGIIYCLSRKKVEEIAETLQVNGINALPYHAGLDSKVRVKHQDAFLMEDADVIVATIAFGMGIDKPDIRFVIHHDIPKSLEGYYQETGRAGRDGGEGICVTFYSYKDIEKLENFLHGKPVSEVEVGRLLILETISFAETSMCRRKYLLHYFGEQFDDAKCEQMCDNCKHPKPKFEGKDFVKKLMTTMLACNESFKAKETVKVLVGESNSLIKQHAMLISDVFACGTDKGKEFWHAVIRQAYVKELITKEIETYGILKVTDEGEKFLKKPYSFQLTEDHDYNLLKTESVGQQKGAAADVMLFKILKDHRKKIAKAKGLPPPIIFLEPSLIDMANQYPITMEEMGQIQGVGQGKAMKYGQSFIDIITKYVEENEIERPSDMMVRSLANKSSNKIYIIQNIDKKLPLSDIASAKGITVDDLLTEIETIVDSGTKINLSYLINEILEDYQIEELDEVLTESDEASFHELREEFDEDEYTDEELRISRIQFISHMGN
ncbi:MAG TPA: RecQ family ATP-dependent DNA helicase [Flavobacteriales bacterium]|jgi:ATP-dependent DNA helicase RecQ|nr:RecQ family ATP-dependent DNA helicase [Flavobacteriales bacterium]HJN63629.1 RecQ family ATP-dependent DNA helicase [Flavobacteriales bacterium]|tara:strand:+ start:8937 stop:11120 length:2184 start_codon:yes stop_codon:yes gene_type:complete